MDDILREKITQVLTEDFGDFLGDFEVLSETKQYGQVDGIKIFTKDGRNFKAEIQNYGINADEDVVYSVWKVVAAVWLKDPNANFGPIHSHPKPKLPHFEVRLDLRTPFDPPPKEKKIKNMVNRTIPEREADVRWQLAFKKQWDKWHK